MESPSLWLSKHLGYLTLNDFSTLRMYVMTDSWSILQGQITG